MARLSVSLIRQIFTQLKRVSVTDPYTRFIKDIWQSKLPTIAQNVPTFLKKAGEDYSTYVMSLHPE